MRLYEVTKPGQCPRTKATECSCERLRQLSEAEKPIKAVAVLEHGDAKGIINFVQKPGKATIISGTISGLTEGLHGFHIHEFGDLSDGCDSAGGHYNPHGVDHGDVDNGHVGDLGNIEANSKGVAEFKIKSKTIQLQGATSIVGRAVVVHEDEDDLGKGGDEESLKTGNAGNRAGCGVITLSELTESAIADLDKNISDKHFKRNEMPQVKEPDLIDNEIPYKKGKISIVNIKPVQTDRVPGLAQKVAKDFHGKDKPFILDKNNYLVNGHHRYDAARLLGIEKVDAIKVDVPIELLMKKFSHTTSDTMVEDVAKLNPGFKLGKLPHEEVESVVHQWVNQEDHIELSNGMHVLSGENHGYADNVALIVDADYKILDHDDDIVELMQQFTAQEIDPSIVENFADDKEMGENYKSQDVTKQGRNLSAKVKKYLKGKNTKLTKVKVSDLDMDTPGFDRIIGDLGDVNFADTTDPIVVDADGKTILDGFHRVQKAKNIGKDEIPAYMVIENFADGKTVEEGPKDFGDMKLDAKGKQDSIDYFYKDHAPSMGKPVKTGKLGSYDIVTVTKGPITLMFLVDANDSAVFYVAFDKYQDGVAIGNVRSNGTVKATDVYAYLVKKYGKLYSDAHQTPSGRKIWDNLSKYTKLKVTDVGDRLVATENFADGKKKGKSRPGRVKKAGASCKGSVSSLRAKAKKYSGERGKMYHWCANMKGGKKKKNESLLVSTFDTEFVKKAKELYNAGQQGQLIRHIYKFTKENSEKIQAKPDLKQMLQDIFYEVSDNFNNEDQIEELLFILDDTLSKPVTESAFENIKLPTWMSHTSIEKLFAQEYGPRYGDYVAHMELDSDDDLAMNASGMGDMAFELVKANDIKVMQKFLAQMPVQFTVDDLKLDKGIQVWHLVQQNKTVH